MANAIPIDDRRLIKHCCPETAPEQSAPQPDRSPNVLLVLGFFYFLPLYWMLVNALKSNDELTNIHQRGIPTTLNGRTSPRAVDVFPFWTFLKNTSIITVLTVDGGGVHHADGCVRVFADPVARSGQAILRGTGDRLRTLPSPDRRPLRYICSTGSGGLARTLELRRGPWINTFKPLIVPYFFCFLPAPFWIFLLRQFFMQIPQELSDAARLDGASELRILFQVIMPQSWPALVAVSLFGALQAWNDFLGPLLYLAGPKKYTLSVGLTFFSSQASHDIKFNLLMAASALVILPVVVLFLSFQRTFVEGVTVGAFK